MSDGSDAGKGRVMVDIETLGLNPGCVVVSIGAVRFDVDGLGDEFSRSVDRESCESAGLETDADTLEWWRNQGEEAREVLTGGVGLETALTDLSRFYGDATEVWANSPSFDLEILAAAYDAVGVVEPWEFYQERDVRTLKSLPVAPDREHDGVKHDALDDARHQARVVSDTLREIGGGE
jgi:hypothetical protein